jgi:hypothetical protein
MYRTPEYKQEETSLIDHTMIQSTDHGQENQEDAHRRIVDDEMKKLITIYLRPVMCKEKRARSQLCPSSERMASFASSFQRPRGLLGKQKQSIEIKL